jgi:hypothetical protein
LEVGPAPAAVAPTRRYARASGKCVGSRSGSSRPWATHAAWWADDQASSAANPAGRRPNRAASSGLDHLAEGARAPGSCPAQGGRRRAAEIRSDQRAAFLLACEIEHAAPFGHFGTRSLYIWRRPLEFARRGSGGVCSCVSRKSRCASKSCREREEQSECQKCLVKANCKPSRTHSAIRLGTRQ